jgi:molybdate transport system substrate-binding protein
MKRLAGVVSLVVGLAMLASCKHSSPPTTVGAAISLKETIEELGPALDKEAGSHVDFAFGASGDLASQMERGAPFDVLVAAGDQPSLAKHATESCTAAWNTLVLVRHRGSADDVAWMTLGHTLPSFRLAIGLVPQVPAGVYAEEALRRLGVWDAVASKTVRGTNVRSVLDLVARGEADAGIVYATDVKVRSDVDVVGEVPAEARPDVRYPVYVSNGATTTSRAVASYLCGRDAKRVLVAHGFLDHPPAGPR